MEHCKENLSVSNLDDFVGLGHSLFGQLQQNLFLNIRVRSNEANTRKRLAKNYGFFEETIPRFNDLQFKEHFRLNRATFLSLLKEIKLFEPVYITRKIGNPYLPIEKQLLVAIWYFSNLEVFRSVADRFGISKSACWFAVVNISEMILKINKEKGVISWPKRFEMERTANNFLSRKGFPGVVGCIDGSHIPIPAPKLHPSSYINRKNFHSVLLQGVCDENLLFIDCYAGEVGSVHDYCMFRRSDLCKRLQNGLLNLREGQHLLGDQGYALQKHLIIPFKNYGNLTPSQRLFNLKHSAVRSSIERAFGLLKGRFRRLQRLNCRKPYLIPLFIIVGCVLHNICIKGEDFYEDGYENDPNIMSGINREPNSRSLQRFEAREAARKRNEIMEYLEQNRS